MAYEKPGFEGSCVEIDSDVFGFCESEGGISAEGADLDSKKLKSVGSLKIIGGLWVFSSITQIIFCSGTGSSLVVFLGSKQSFLRSNFTVRWILRLCNTVRIYKYTSNEQHCCSAPSSWVGYSEPGFEGQQHILEEGEYLDCGGWGGSEQLLSLRPVLAVSTTPLCDQS